MNILPANRGSAINTIFSIISIMVYLLATAVSDYNILQNLIIASSPKA
jgi:hypothetical protein